MKSTKAIFITTSLLLLAAMAMADTTTTRTGMTKPDVGSVNWGPKLDTDFDIADSTFAALGQTNTFSQPQTFSSTNTFVGITASTITVSSFTATNVSITTMTATSVTISTMNVSSFTVTALNVPSAFTATSSSVGFTNTASTLTVNSFIQFKGTPNTTNARAGDCGEVISASLTSGSAEKLTTATAIGISTITLTAGDWDVYGVVGYIAGAGTTVSQVGQGSSTTANAIDNEAGTGFSEPNTTASAAVGRYPIPTARYQVNGNTNVYLTSQPTFASGTLSAFGYIYARRPCH